MDGLAYTTVQSIREGAGLFSRSANETPFGDRDGSNKKFVVKRRPIIDQNYDDVVGSEDVNVYVNGAKVSIASIDAIAGEVTLVTAPAVGTKVTIDYAFSGVTAEYVTQKGIEAQDWVDGKLRQYVTVPLSGPIPGTITTITELFAAGLILTRDWGNRVDSAQTSKDGAAKIKQARELLNDFIESIKADIKQSNSNNGNTASVITDSDVFGRRLNGYDCDPEDEFMRRSC